MYQPSQRNTYYTFTAYNKLKRSTGGICVGKVLPQKAEPLPVYVHLASPVRFCWCESRHQRKGVGESVVCHLWEMENVKVIFCTLS